VIAERLPELDVPYPEIGNDRKDDYLFAHAVVGQADYLVSGDGGVRVIDRIGDVRIVSPAEFIAILDTPDRHP
jgi:predicted nucleic acid-binding protein